MNVLVMFPGDGLWMDLMVVGWEVFGSELEFFS